MKLFVNVSLNTILLFIQYLGFNEPELLIEIYFLKIFNFSNSLKNFFQ